MSAKTQSGGKSFNRDLGIAGVLYTYGNPETINSQDVRVLQRDKDGYVLQATGTATITDGADGYAKGCLYIDTDVTTGSTGIYENVGTTTSCNFDTIGSGGGGSTTFIGLTDVPATFTAQANKIVKVNTGATALEFVTISGDVAMSSAGATTVTDLTITSEAQGDVLYRGASTWGRLSAKTSGYILVGDGTDLKSVAVSGDVALANTGAATVTDLTIASEAQGDVLYFNGANWVRLAAGASGKFLKTQGASANPIWDTVSVAQAQGLLSPFELEGGTYDPLTTVTAQTTSAAALTIPDLAGVAQEWVFSKKAQTLENKTLTTPIIATGGAIVDAGGDEYVVFVEDATPIEHLQITAGDAGVGVELKAATSATNASLHLTASGSGNVIINNGIDLVFDGTTNDLTIVAADQTAGARTLNLPNQTAASDTIALLAETQTLTNKTLSGNVATGLVYSVGGNAITFQDAVHTVVGRDTTDALSNKTLTAPKIVTTGYIADGGGDEFLYFVESATPVNAVQIQNSDASAPVVITAFGSDANIDLKLYGKATGNVVLADGTTPTKDLVFELSGATADKTMTIISSQSDDRSLTLPNATDTLVGKATTDTLTNKTLDCNGTGNVVTNVNAEELDPITPAGAAVVAVPFVITQTFTNPDANGVDIFTDNAPYKFRILSVESVCIGGTGTWVLQKGKVGALGTAITDVVTVAADKDVDRASTIDDAQYEIAANGSLVLVGDVGGSLDINLVITAIRVDA